MTNNLYKKSDIKVSDIINKYKYSFLGITKKDIEYLNKKFDLPRFSLKIEDLEYMVYSHFSNQEKKYKKQIETLQKYSNFSCREISNIYHLLIKTSNFRDIIYISDKFLPHLIENECNKTFKFLKIYIKKEDLSKFRDTLNIDGLDGIKFDSNDYVDDEFGFDFYLGNVLVKVNSIDKDRDSTIIKSFNKENYEKSFNAKYIYNIKKENLLKTREGINYINFRSIDKENIKEFNYSLEELEYYKKKKKILMDLELDRETQKRNSILIKNKKRGFVSIYLTMMALSWILAGYTFFTIIKGVIK